MSLALALHPRLHEEATRQQLRETWRRRGRLRVEPLWEAEVASAVHAALHGQPYALQATGPAEDLKFQFWSLGISPEASPSPFLGAVSRWVREDLRLWVEQISGLSLIPDPKGQVMSTLYGQGCFLDPHNDIDGERAVAYVIGLTVAGWPGEEGGHLEFLEGTRVVERRPPGWNTLDLFHVEAPRAPTHRIPILRAPRERRALSGWFHAARG